MLRGCVLQSRLTPYFAMSIALSGVSAAYLD